MFGKDYGPGSRLLHRAALSSPAILQAAFEADGIAFKSQVPADDRHVFIAGLARAGTTILLRVLYESGKFRSLTYRDMPFVLMPNLWRRLSSLFRKDATAAERAHGDGILVSFDSPEAFEEVFWRAFCGTDYLYSDCLTMHTADSDTLESFRIYVHRIIGDAADCRYLSKNNNNVLRLWSLREAFPKALLIVPFRDPIQQAASLLKQHQHFVRRQSLDSFVRNYMTWLGHHEFGLDSKPFRFRSYEYRYPKEELNYWLEIWVQTYEHLLNNSPPDAIFVCYEDLCRQDGHALRWIMEAAGVDASVRKSATERFVAPKLHLSQGAENEMRQRAYALYAMLANKAAMQQASGN